MLNIGCHLSISKGFYKTGLEAVSIGANTFQFFTRNPRGGKAKDLELEDVKKLANLMEEHNFAPLFAHASYTMNLCSDKPDIREFAKNLLKDDLKRLNILPKACYIFHPGSHVKQGKEKGIEYIVNALNEVIDADNEIPILIEGMSGKGTEIGRDLDELKEIIEGVKHNKNVGVCLDTCHLYSSGYDIVNNLEGVLEEVDNKIGLKRVQAIHLNDSKMEFNSHKDRHEVIGKGTIGMKAIVNIINHPKLRNLPFNLETPNDIEGYKKEIEILRKAYM